jgi:hypothetical protein
VFQGRLPAPGHVDTDLRLPRLEPVVEEVVRDFTNKVEEEFDEIADGNQTAR